MASTSFNEGTTGSNNVSLGVCWYPDQWSVTYWNEDVKGMNKLGLKYVRLAEFAWALMEPTPGNYSFQWLDDALQVIQSAGLKAVLGTPTATPPKWLIDQNPSILPVDINNNTRRFGSRRHYTFSSDAYLKAANSIVLTLAQRYGNHPAVAGWQVDNELGCHDTVRSYSEVIDLPAFRNWLRQKYGTIDALNTAWGTNFWSERYGSFTAIDLPNLTVTEANPAAWLDFYRFSSDQVVKFTKAQVTILRQYSPNRFITTNMMEFFFDFDHFAVADLIDFTAFDNYPLGFLAAIPTLPDSVKQQYSQIGHPDIASFHHDLYRSMSQKGTHWVMEQQPGPVNWAPYNPSPLPGVVRLWTWEGFAHGADVVSYFRWRQVPYAQEQMHSGLFRPDNVQDLGYSEASQVQGELNRLIPIGFPSPTRASVAIVFDYEAHWLLSTEPQSIYFNYIFLVWQFYGTLRTLGLDIDIVRPGTSLNGYKLVVVPSLPVVTESALNSFTSFLHNNKNSALLFGPRTGSKTSSFQIPDNLPPGILQSLLPLKVTRVESLPPYGPRSFQWKGDSYQANLWVEWVETSTLKQLGQFADGKGAGYFMDNLYYLNFWPQEALYEGKDFLQNLLRSICQGLSLDVQDLSPDMRLRSRGSWKFAFNYNSNTAIEAPAPQGANFVLGTRSVQPLSVSVWVEQ